VLLEEGFVTLGEYRTIREAVAVRRAGRRGASPPAVCGQNRTWH
jgi:hypothetical protein